MALNLNSTYTIIIRDERMGAPTNPNVPMIPGSNPGGIAPVNVNIDQRVNMNVHQPATSGQSKKVLSAMMPMLNDLSGGAAGKVNQFTQMGSRVVSGFLMGGAVVGGLMVAGEVYKIAREAIAEEKKKNENANNSDILKIRMGLIQPGVESLKKDWLGRVNYNR